ncbi:glucosaminidase domain-containing protein [Hahella aquimaris]|uniref:glucosaminidase domain-containing protein n=1 Tax=Hahella sp. HNIBRBA332 TaxID=3015983 RepID=UPI00273A8B73|nr:glucosaminidase domain-containing protein [Hahella sp. HNIBRBA332]WLQ14613.1 glucosaminidase domain-containing protein [Hahella sp. HNIBRBA332]
MKNYRSYAVIAFGGALAWLFTFSLWYDLHALAVKENKKELKTSNVNLIPTAPLPDFSRYEDVGEKKEAFFSYLLPLVQQANRQIKEERQFIQKMQRQTTFSTEDTARLQRLAEAYRVPFDNAFNNDFFKLMLRRVDTIPPSLVLAQAANESGWGGSRFAREGNNLFGQWCFKPGCGIEPAQRASHLQHEVARFDTVYHSVMSYMRNLNRNLHYIDLRKTREKLRAQGAAVTGQSLTPGLAKYSTRGEAYIAEIQGMIRTNDLEKYDHPGDAATL